MRPKPTEASFHARAPRGIRQQNVSAIVRTVLAHGPVARTDIARLTGLSGGSVTRVTTELVEAGLLQELPGRSNPRSAGAPRVPLDFARERYAVLGVHIGALRTTIGLVDIRGAAIVEERHEHPTTEPTAVLDRAAELITDFAARHGAGRHLLGVGVTLAGWVDPATGTVIEHDALGWRDVAVAKPLADRLTLPVLVESSVRARALAELWSGAGTSAHSLVYLFIGTVVDAAIVIDRRVHNGPRSAAGTIAHLQLHEGDTQCDCGRRGCLQAHVSDLAVLERARECGLTGVRTIQDLVDRARDVDDIAETVLRDRATRVGEAVAVLVDLIDPDLVVFSDNAVMDTPGYLAAVRHGAVAQAHTPIDAEGVIVPTAFAEHAIVIAPATRVLDAFYEAPLNFLTTTAVTSA